LKGNIMSATEKTFTVAGTAINADGTVKARFANDLVARIKILNKAGCTEINLVELPRAMTKMAERAKVAKKGEVKVAAKGVKAKATKSVTAEQLVEAAKA